MSIFSKFILKKITVFLSLFCAVFVAVFSATDFSVSAEAGQTGLDSAYVDMADPGPVYALFGMDLTSYSGMLSSLLSNFELLNESDASCGTATSASLLAMFYDIENQFVELEFSSVNCPESTSPARLKFIDPGNSSIYDIVDILDVSEIGSGGGGELEDWGSTTGDDHEVIVDISFDSWEEYPIYIFGIYGESGEGDLGGYTSISAPGIVSIYVPHADDEDYVTIVAAWWDSPDLDMDSDPAMMGFSDPILIDGSGPTSIEILLEENVGGGGGDGPQIGNVSYSNITGTSVSLSSEIISLADRTITRRGFILDRLSDNFTINVSEDSMSGFGTGVYSLSALNLDCGTNYNVRPFIMDSTYSEWHGSTVNFTTGSCGGGGGSNVNYDVYVRMGDEYEWDDVEGASVNFGAYSCDTNDGGWCSVSDVIPGSYTITVTADYYEDYSAESITIDSDNRSYIAYMTPTTVGSLSGLITDGNSDGIDGATVFSILFDSDTPPLSPATTSGGGHFSFSDLYEGSGHFVMAAKDGYVGKYIGPGDLLMSNDNSHYDMQLETATSANSGSISGSFTIDDVPVSGLKVLVFTFGDDEGWPEVLGFGFGETDALGEYVVNGLAPADSYMVFFVEDFVEYEGVGMHFASVTAGQDTGLDYNILAPDVATVSATNVGVGNARLTASIGDTYEVNSIGYLSFDNIDESGFEYGTAVGGVFTDQSDWTDEDDDTGEFYTEIYSLDCGTEYQYRAFASTAAGTDYGETMYFTTASCGGGASSASTDGSSNATKDSVTLSGSFNVASGDVVTRRGFEYGTDIAYGSSVFEDGNWNSGSSYSLNISGTLACGTTHHFRAYVTLSDFMTYYGADMTFSTVSCDDGGGGEDGDLEGAYVDGSDFSAVYALFGSDLSGFSEMIPMLNSNFELLNVNDVSCGAASSASLMATFYDVQNRFVQLGFSSINCPESTSPVKLKFTDPGDPSKYQLIDLQDVSDIGAGGTTADWSTQTGDDHFTVVTVSYEDWVQYPIVVVGWYADSVESVSGDPAGFVAISSPGIATLYIPHEEGADYVVLAALWWNNAEMDGDPSLIGFYDTPISIDGPGTTSIAIDLGETGGGNAVTAAQAAGVLACEFVDSDWQSLSSLNVSTSPLSYDPVSPIYANSVLGNDSSYILIANPTSNPTWTLSVAPTDGEDALWSDGDGNYADFNDSDTGDDDDLDGFGGRLSINPVLGTLFTYSLDYSNDGISVGSYASFTDGSVNNITLLTADEFSDAPGYWGLKNIGIDQIFPAGQDVGTYTFDLTISVI